MSPVKLGTSKRQRGLLLALAVGALLAVIMWIWIHPKPLKREPRPLSAIQAAQAWLECIDCQGPFLRRIHDLPTASRDSAVQFLATALRKGPDSARMARHERDLRRAWADDSLHRERLHLAEGGPNQEAAFLERYREGFKIKWRGRAAMALGVIRSDSALAALDGTAAALDSALVITHINFSDVIVRHWVARSRSDTLGPQALNQYP